MEIKQKQINNWSLVKNYYIYHVMIILIMDGLIVILILIHMTCLNDIIETTVCEAGILLDKLNVHV